MATRNFSDSSVVHGASVFIDQSQFPEKVRADLVESLRSRRINHKFHYDSYKQAQKWLALHEAYSPARKDLDCQRIYEDAFRTVMQNAGRQVHLIGLGCGGGQKEAMLLRLMKERGTDVAYSPCDVSLALVLTALTNASGLVEDGKCSPVVCDLAEADNVATLFDRSDSTAPRVITFFGMIPNFEPDVILPKLRSLLRAEDRLLVSANLAPGSDYVEGVQKILPQYDNELTMNWMVTLLLDLGVEKRDGEVVFSIEETKHGFKRVAADFIFNNARELRLGNDRFVFKEGDRVRLFFSYRYQPAHIVALL
ncbi:MAG: L-histidine N(alpha)-methyltransferase [Limisphaerales bacterium]